MGSAIHLLHLCAYTGTLRRHLYLHLYLKL